MSGKTTRAAEHLVGKKATAKRIPHASKYKLAVASTDAIAAHVIKIGEARENLSKIVVDIGSDVSRSVVVGSRGKPTMMCVSYQRFKPLLEHGNRSEKLALLIVEELLADAPEHIRTPAIRELSALPMEDLECLWGIDALPLTMSRAHQLKRKMKNPEALDRLAQRAHVAHVLSEARDAGLYDTLSDATSEVVDGVGE
jgi:hypothetical protein